MNRRGYLVIVVFYTIFNIGVLVLLNNYTGEYKKENVEYKDFHVEVYDNEEKNQQIISEEESKENDEKYIKNKEKLELSQDNNDNVEDKLNIMYESDKDIYNNSSNNYNESSYYDKNKNIANESNQVFKLTAEEIIRDLTPIEKAKILWVCRKLTKEEYNDIEEYLSYRNEKLGVIKVYNILESKLDEESLGEVKDIFSKYMDLTKVEEIN